VYNPEHFLEDRVEVLHALIRGHSLAAVVTLGSAGLEASHVPLLLDAEPPPFGTLRGHLSRANPQWRDFSPGVPALAIFSGVERYISPSWYPSKQEHGRVVPTWNYVAVHAYGRLRTFDDPARLRALVGALTAAHESGFDRPWSIDDAPAAFIDAQLKAIIGIEFTVERLEGKWKVSQNRPPADRAGIVSALRSLGAGPDLAMAEAVERAARESGK
jgi:transcriptional regulator